MAREFDAKIEAPKDEVTLRDILALLMPCPPFSFTDPNNRIEIYMAEMRARYQMADRIIKEVR